MAPSEILIAVPVVAVLLAVIFVVFVTRVSEKKISVLRARGDYPEDGKETEEDVVKLLQSGQKNHGHQGLSIPAQGRTKRGERCCRVTGKEPALSRASGESDETFGR